MAELVKQNKGEGDQCYRCRRGRRGDHQHENLCGRRRGRRGEFREREKESERVLLCVKALHAAAAATAATVAVVVVSPFPLLLAIHLVTAEARAHTSRATRLFLSLVTPVLQAATGPHHHYRHHLHHVSAATLKLGPICRMEGSALPPSTSLASEDEDSRTRR